MTRLERFDLFMLPFKVHLHFELSTACDDLTAGLRNYKNK